MWKIMVVDDNAANRELLVEVVAEVADCVVAGNGREAFEHYKKALAGKHPFDLILLDIAMPEVDGLAFLEMVRKFEADTDVELGQGVPIIMVTAFDQPFMRAFNLGCDDYILKPIDADQLLGKIKMKLAGKK
ncbi:MAG: response regulator [Candidatus Omnitrophica bacterium]|nr:response regulator [Candidatus Omnitrophota bacterium]